MKSPCLVLLLWLAFVVPGYTQDNLDQLLQSVKKAGPGEGRVLLRKGIKRLVAGGDVERQELARKLAEVLPVLTQTPEEVAEVLGSEKQVSRQVFYRRYQEQWIYDSPLPLLVVFDVRKGSVPKVLTVRPLSLVLP